MTVPVTVVGGFLGAGKTTLINRILAAAPARTAVLVNDFGEINVDFDLVKTDDDLIFELSGGCICCSMAEGVGPAIKRALTTRPEVILIESSGVGEPRRVAEFALLDPALRLDMIVTLANAVELSEQVSDPLIGDTVVRQFDGADLIVLNHTDAAPPETLAEAHAILRRLAVGRRVVETVAAELPLDMLTASTHAIFSAGPMVDTSDHGGVYSSATYVGPDAVERAGFEAALAALPRSVLRLKGWVRLTDEPVPMLVQYVAGRWTLTPAPDAPTETRLVAIAASAEMDLAETLQSIMKSNH